MRKAKTSRSAPNPDAFFENLRRFTLKVEELGDNDARKAGFVRLINEIKHHIASGGVFHGGIPSCFDDPRELYFLLELIACRRGTEHPFFLAVRKKDLYGSAFKAGRTWYEYRFQDIFHNALSKSGVSSTYKAEDPFLSPSIFLEAIDFFFEGDVMSDDSDAQYFMEVIIYFCLESCRFLRIFHFTQECLGGDYYTIVRKPLVDMRIIKRWGGLTDSLIDAKFHPNNTFQLQLIPEDNGNIATACASIGVFSYEDAKRTVGLLKLESIDRTMVRLQKVGRELSLPFPMPRVIPLPGAKRQKNDEIKQVFWSNFPEKYALQDKDGDVRKSLQNFVRIIVDGSSFVDGNHPMAHNMLKSLGVYRVDSHKPSQYILHIMNSGVYELPSYLFQS